MDLKNNKIQMRELLANPTAKVILKREFSQFDNPLLLAFAGKMTLENVLELAKGKVDDEKIQNALRQLEEI